MQFNKRWFLPILMVVTLLLVACGGAAATPTPVVENTTVAPTTATDSSGEGAAVATKAPAATAEATEVTEEPTEEAAEPTEAASDDSDDTDSEAVGSVESLDGINSYRFKMEILATGEAFELDEDMAMMGGGVTIEGAIVKEPPAQNIEISLGGSPAFGFRIADGKSYTNFGGEWVESEDSEAPAVDDFLPVTPEEIANVLDEVERIGVEDVDGRPATHYYANKEQLAEIAATQGEDSTFDFADAEEAGLDFWVDEENGFISKMDLVASGTGLNEDDPDLEGELQLHVEYTDVNEDIEIEAPEISTTLPDSGDVVTDTDTTTDTSSMPDVSMGDGIEAVNTLVGFDLGFPEDAQAYVIGDYASVVVEMTAEETNAMIVDVFEANGYTLNEDASFVEAGLYQFDSADAKWSVITSESSGMTTIIISPVTE